MQSNLSLFSFMDIVFIYYLSNPSPAFSQRYFPVYFSKRILLLSYRAFLIHSDLVFCVLCVLFLLHVDNQLSIFFLLYKIKFSLCILFCVAIVNFFSIHVQSTLCFNCSKTLLANFISRLDWAKGCPHRW